MDDNYSALIVSILLKVGPEKAFSLIGVPTRERHYSQDSRTMYRYRKQGYKVEAIAHWYGMKSGSVEKRISRYKAALG